MQILGSRPKTPKMAYLVIVVYFFDKIGFADEDAIGVRNLIGMLKEKFPAVRLGYYNPPLRK